MLNSHLSNEVIIKSNKFSIVPQYLKVIKHIVFNIIITSAKIVILRFTCQALNHVFLPVFSENTSSHGLQAFLDHSNYNLASQAFFDH